LLKQTLAACGEFSPAISIGEDAASLTGMAATSAAMTKFEIPSNSIRNNAIG
jgi:hypothetical protein